MLTIDVDHRLSGQSVLRILASALSCRNNAIQSLGGPRSITNCKNDTTLTRAIRSRCQSAKNLRIWLVAWVVGWLIGSFAGGWVAGWLVWQFLRSIGCSARGPMMTPRMFDFPDQQPPFFLILSGTCPLAMSSQRIRGQLQPLRFWLIPANVREVVVMAKREVKALVLELLTP